MYSFCIIFVVQEAVNIISKMNTLLTGFRSKVVWDTIYESESSLGDRPHAI